MLSTHWTEEVYWGEKMDKLDKKDKNFKTRQESKERSYNKETFVDGLDKNETVDFDLFDLEKCFENRHHWQDQC